MQHGTSAIPVRWSVARGAPAPACASGTV